jgi:hypothetical protein
MNKSKPRHSKLSNLKRWKKKREAPILVAVRSRPLSAPELTDSPNPIVKVIDNKVAVLLNTTTDINAPEQIFRKNRTREKHFAFDHVFDELAG